MESEKLFRMALALVVSVSGAAMYAGNAVAHPACPIISGAPWGTNSACCTASNGKSACSWGEFDSSGKVLKATADGPSPCSSWVAGAFDSAYNPTCAIFAPRNGTFVGIGNTSARACPSQSVFIAIHDGC